MNWMSTSTFAAQRHSELRKDADRQRVARHVRTGSIRVNRR